MWGNHHLRPREGGSMVPVMPFRGDLGGQDNEHLKELDDAAFRIFDRNGDGHISPEELRLTMQILGLGETNIGAIMEILDTDGNGTLEIEEFARSMMQARTDIEDHVEEVLEKAFGAFDKDKDGVLSREELLLLMKSLLGTTPSDGEIQSMISQADTDGDGYISYNEFCETLKKGNW